MVFRMILFIPVVGRTAHSSPYCTGVCPSFHWIYRRLAVLNTILLLKPLVTFANIILLEYCSKYSYLTLVQLYPLGLYGLRPFPQLDMYVATCPW